jgi:hypothetical protein
MGVGFIVAYAIRAYHHWRCEFEYSIQHYVKNVARDLRQVAVFTNETDGHNIAEILLKVALDTTILTISYVSISVMGK